MLLGVGYAAWRKKNQEHAKGGGSDAEIKAHYGGTYHPVLIALTVFSSAFSGYTVVGVPQTTLDSGFLVLMFFAGTAAQSIGMLVFFPRLRRIGVARGYISPMDFVADRFRHKGITSFIVLAACLPQFVYLAVQLASFGETLNTLSNGLVDKSSGIFCCAFVMLSMELLGGMHSVVLTDIVQAVIMLFGFAALTFVMHSEFDVFNIGAGCESSIMDITADLAGTVLNCRSPNASLPAGFNTFPEMRVEYGCITSPGINTKVPVPFQPLTRPFANYTLPIPPGGEAPPVSLGTVVMAVFFWFTTNFIPFSCNPHMIQRIYLAEKDAGIRSVALLMIFAPFFAMGPGLLAGLLVAANWFKWGSNEVFQCRGTAFAILANEVAAKGDFQMILVTILAVAALAAIMSSADSVILGVSNSLCIDVYKNMISKDADTNTIVRMGQLISVFMTFICYFFAMNINGTLFSNWLTVQNGILLQIAPAMYYGLHGDIHAKAIFHGIVVGMVLLPFVLYAQIFDFRGTFKAIFTLLAGPSFCAIMNLAVVKISNCCQNQEYIPVDNEYTTILADRHGDHRLTTEKIQEIMVGTVEPNGWLLTIAVIMVPLTIPFYTWDAQIGIFPGWALMSFGMILLCTTVIFMAAISWRTKEHEEPLLSSGETFIAEIELKKLGSRLQ